MDITEQTSLASSSPEDAAQHIEKASIFNIEPTAYKNFKDELNSTADQLQKPSEAPPAVAGFMQQSSEHAALAVPDVEHLSYIERQANLISDYIFDRPTNEKKVINLSNKKMHDPAAFSEDDQISLDNLNFERSQLAKNNYGLDGPIEQLPAKVAGAISGMVRSTGDAVENIIENPLHIKGGVGGLALKAGFGAAKAMYDSVAGSTYNELSNLQDENGKPLNIDEATKKGVSQGVGIVGTALQSVVGFGIMKTTPFLTKFINPSIARTIVEDPAMAAVKTTLLNIAGNASLMGGTAALNAATSIVGEEIAKSYDGSEASFLNGITAAGERIKKNPSQVLEPALVGAATGVTIAGATGVAGFSATKSRFQAMSEFINENRQANARDVTPQAQARLAGEAPLASGEHPIDVTPPEIGGGDPIVQATKAVQLREAMTNIGKVQDQTNMAKVSPTQLGSITKMIFDKAGLSRVWMSAEDVNKFTGDDPKKSEAVRNLIDSSGVAARQQNAPLSVEPHKFMELVKQYPEVMDLMRIDPEGPTPTQAESYLGNLESVHQKRETLLKELGDQGENPNAQAVIDQALTPVKNVGDKVAGGVDWHGDTLLLSEQEYLNQPTFSEAIKAVVPAAEIVKYNEAQLKARTHVAEQINDKANANLIKVQDADLQNQLEQQRQMELARLEADPNYEIVDRVQASLKSVKGTKNVGIYQVDPASLTDAQLGKYLTNPQLKEYGIFRKGAGSVENAAQMAGVASPDAFLDILANTPPRERVVAARVAAAEATKAKDVLDNVKLDETKLAKAFSDNTKNHIAEMKFMREQQWPAAKSGIKRIALPLPKMEELTYKARTAVKSMKVKDLNIQQFKVGERASQRAAVNAILKNEVERAFMNKEAAALNSEFQKETAIAIGNVNKVFDFARRFNRPEIKAALKEAGPGYEKAVAEIFDVFRLDPSMRGASEKGSFQKWVQKRLAAGDGNFEIPERLSDVRQSANELSVAQLELVGDRLRAILHMAQWKNRLYSQHLRAYLELSKERALATEELVAADLHELALSHPDYKDRPIAVQGSKPAGEQVRGILATAQSLFNNLEHIVTTLDQELVGGKWHDLLVKPIKGDGKYNGIMGESGSNKDLSILKKQLEKIIEAYGPKDFIDLENTVINVPEFAGLERLNNGRLSKGELIGLMLNGGDPDGITNRANLGVSNEIINKVLERELDERDAVYAQSLLDTVGSYGERSAKLQLETTGQTVDLIKGVPFTHRGRSYPGGYWPQAYKVDFNAKIIKRGLEDRVAAVFGGKDSEIYARQYAAEMTEQGRLQDRVGSGQALDLSMFRQARVFEEIIHDLNYRVPVRDTLKLLKNPSIRKDIVSIVGPEKYGVVTNTVVEAANRIEAENNNYFSDQNRLVKSFFGQLNGGMSVGLLAANLSSIMIQPVSLVSTVQKMGMINGTKHLVNVLQKMARNPMHIQEFYEFAAEINPSIRNHMEGIEDSLTSTVHDLLPSRNVHKSMAPIRRAQEWMINHAMEGMGMADQMIKTFGSLAAYGQYMAGDAEGFPLAKVMALPEAERHQAAMDYARQMSRTTLTHGAPSDKAPIQKLPLGSFFVKFWNDLRNVFNTTLSQTRKAKWHLQDMNAALGEGHTIPDSGAALTAGKNAGAILMGMVVAATIEKVYEDYWRHKKTPFDQNFDFKTAEGRAQASKYMSKYMMTAPPELFVESIPGFRDIKYGSEKIDDRHDTRNAKVPLVKIGDDMATTYKALDDMLTLDGKTSFSPEQTKAMLFTLSYISGGFPVNGAYKALRWWNSNSQEVMEIPGRVASIPEMLGETIKKYVADAPKGTTPETIAQLEELNGHLNPQEKGIPPDTYDIIKNISSGGSWTKSNSANGAAGIYQFTESQWKDISKAAPDLGLTENGRVSKDSGQQEKAMQFQTQANAKQLGAQDLPVDAETLYGAHILGADKAVKLYQAAADTKLKTILKVEDFAAHPEFQNYKTVGQVRKLIKSQVNDKRLTLTDGKTED